LPAGCSVLPPYAHQATCGRLSSPARPLRDCRTASVGSPLPSPASDYRPHDHSARCHDRRAGHPHTCCRQDRRCGRQCGASGADRDGAQRQGSTARVGCGRRRVIYPQHDGIIGATLISAISDADSVSRKVAASSRKRWVRSARSDLTSGGKHASSHSSTRF